MWLRQFEDDRGGDAIGRFKHDNMTSDKAKNMSDEVKSKAKHRIEQVVCTNYRQQGIRVGEKQIYYRDCIQGSNVR